MAQLRQDFTGQEASQSGVIAAISSQSSALADLQAQMASLSAQLAQNTATSSASVILANEVRPESTSSATDSGVVAYAPPQNDNTELNLTPPDILLATQSAQLVNLSVTSDATISGLLTTYDLNIQNSLKSLGQTTLANTLIAGDLTIDGTLSLTGSSLSTLGPLYIQNSPLAGPVDFFNGLITIDSKGSVLAQKVATPEVVTNKLTISNTPIASASASLQPSIGSATIPAGQTEVPVFTAQASDTAKIFLTPRASTGKQSLYVKEVVAGTGFAVGIDKRVNNDINFDWWIVETKE